MVLKNLFRTGSAVFFTCHTFYITEEKSFMYMYIVANTCSNNFQMFIGIFILVIKLYRYKSCFIAQQTVSRATGVSGSLLNFAYIY